MKIKKSTIFGPNAQIWVFRLKILKTKFSRKFQISPILKFLGYFGLFSNFFGRFGWFRLVLAGFEKFWIVRGHYEYCSG